MAEQNAHSRMISANFKKSLLSGALSPAVDLVREDPDLFLGLRKEPDGGSYVDIYYKCHVLFEIHPRGGTTFNSDHARYTADWAEKKQKLLVDLKMEENGNNLKRTVETPDPDFWREAGAILKSVIADYFALPEEQIGPKKKKKCLEKQAQHSLVLANQFLDNGFFVYDIEYKEPGFRPWFDCRFDLLALQIKDKEVVDLWILEVKTDSRSTVNDHGVADHYTDMNTYKLDRRFAGQRKQRWIDAELILRTYQELYGWAEIPAFPKEPPELKFGFVMTGEADQVAEEFAKQFPDVPFFIPNRKDKNNFVLDINDVCVPKELP